MSRSPEGKADWRQYPRGRDIMPPMSSSRPMYYSNFPPGAPPPPQMLFPDQYSRERFPSSEWRPERDYRREYDRRQQ